MTAASVRRACIAGLTLFAVWLSQTSVAVAAGADVWLDYDFGEGMVLQEGVPAKLHGTAQPGEKFSIAFRDKTYEVVADKLTSAWQAEIVPGVSGGPFPLTIKCVTSIELKNVTVAPMQFGPVFSDGMVLQRGPKAPVYGTAPPGEKLTISFRDKNYEVTSNEKGMWRTDVDPGAAGGPFTLSVKGKSVLELKDVYVGDVWVCSGQSNMRWGVGYTNELGKLKLDPPNQQLRLQRFPQDIGYDPNHPPKRFTGWKAADAKSVPEFSGTGYFFGAALQEKLKVPVGLIQAAYDSTGIREWMPAPKEKELNVGANGDGGQYARQVRAIQPFAIRGVIWYQGEANAGKDVFNVGYDRLQAALIEGWRSDWGQGDFPFYFVQLPRIGFGAEQVHGGKLPSPEQREIVGDWARIRNEQRLTLNKVSHTAMAIYYEQTTGTLHPVQKRFAGERLALAARALTYGETIEYSGPLIESAALEKSEAVLTFSHAEGLSAKDGDLRQFEVKSASQDKFTPAKARIDGKKVRLDVSGLTPPLTIRYAYREWPDGNLYNAAGLPASPFSLDVK